ncbi:MAG TPA: dUTP diphosphatase [Candidatus Nanoarchaeia archaeon]|nr:dUTP diphosphatase [Candidatus Nanoarchaeia archaeon]
MSLTLKIVRMDKSLPLPKYALQGDAAFDLLASEAVTFKPGERVQVKTGLKMEIPEGYVGFIWDKSGLSHKGGLKTLGGVIDSSYRGEVMVGMINLSDAPYTFERGNKVAQMCIQKKEDVTIVEAEELSETARGEGGFGSTGK